MSKPYKVGRGSAADIRIPKTHDTVGNLHLQIEELGPEKVVVTDLKSANGTFLRVGSKWEEITQPRIVSRDAEIMLGEYQTTPRRLLAEAAAEPADDKKYRSTKDEPEPSPKPKRTGPRRNEFGEIVNE